MRKIFWCAVIALCIFVGNIANEADEARANNIESLASIPETENEQVVEQPITNSTYEVEEEEFYGRCMATTKRGTQCKRSASRGSHYCWQHK